MAVREMIKQGCYRMKEGERIEIDGRMFADAFPCGWPSMYRTSEETFLATMISSAWGLWRLSRNYENGNIIIDKHEPDGKRYYTCPDREHLFERQADGTLKRKNETP